MAAIVVILLGVVWAVSLTSRPSTPTPGGASSLFVLSITTLSRASPTRAYSSGCEDVLFSPPINGTPTICDLPPIGLSTNSTTALTLAKVNLTSIYVQAIHAQAFQQRVAGFVWNAGGWGPYTQLLENSTASWGVYFPSGDNYVVPRGVAFWFQVRAQNGTSLGQFFGAYDLAGGNYTFSPFHPHPQQPIFP